MASMLTTAPVESMLSSTSGMAVIFMGYSRDVADRIKKRLDKAIDGIL